MSNEHIPEIPVDARHFALEHAPKYASTVCVRAIEMPRPFQVQNKHHGLMPGAPGDYLVEHNDDPEDRQPIRKDIFEATYHLVVEGKALESDTTMEELAQALHEAGRAAVEAGLVVNKVPGQPFLEWDQITEAARQGRRVQACHLLAQFHILHQVRGPFDSAEALIESLEKE